MKAAITPSYGPAEVLEVRELPKPQLGPKDLLVEVHASAVTEGDRRMRSADFPGMTAVPGRLMLGILGPRRQLQGTMFAGRVVAVGSGVTRYAVGDDVFGSVDSGAYAEYVAVAENGPLAKIPAGVGYGEAAATPYGAVTALRFLRELGEVQAGESVLILGASGGVGRYAVQLAKHLGAEVTGVCSDRNAALVTSLGADHVIDYASEDFTQNGEQYDVIFDIAGASSFGRSRSSLTPGGRYLTLYMSLEVLLDMALTKLMGGRQARFTVALGTREDIDEIGELLAAHVITPVVADQFELHEIAKAHARQEGTPQGTVVVTMGSQARALAA